MWFEVSVWLCSHGSSDQNFSFDFFIALVTIFRTFSIIMYHFLQLLLLYGHLISLPLRNQNFGT